MSFRTNLIAAGVLAAAVAVAAPAIHAEEQATYRFDLPAQSLMDALQAIARQTGSNVLFQSKDLNGIKVSELKGEFTASEAIERVLTGTKLQAQQTTPSTMIVQPIASASQLESWAGIRLAQVESSEKTAVESTSSKDEGGVKLEEIVVTAQRREQNLQDVPISITVLSGAQLDASSDSGITEALRFVPGVVTNVAQQGGGTTISVRGVAAAGDQFNGSTPIGFYLDGVPFGLVKGAIVPDASGYDLDRVEVLRGPQGTLYGASALGGVVRVLTKDPDLNDFELKARTSYSKIKDGEDGGRVDAAVNVPLIADKLAARAVVGYDDIPGWIDRPNGGGKNSNDARNVNLRLKLKAQPTDALSLGLSAVRYRSDQDAPLSSVDSRSTPVVGKEPSNTDYDTYGLNVNYAFEHFSLTSATSYMDFAQRGLWQLGQTLETIRDASVFAQEVNLTSQLEAPWRWSLGGIYRKGKDTAIQNYGAYTPVVPLNWADQSKAYAVFGEITRLLFAGRLEATAGLRYFEDDVTQREIEDFTLNFSPGDGLSFDNDKFHKVTPRLALTWHPRDALTTYVSYAEGFRSGSQQNPLVLLQAPDLGPLKADTLKNYEVGAKGSFWGGRLAFDTAVFYVDWQDIQQPLAVPYQTTYVSANANGVSASGMGYDIGVVLKPIEGLTLAVNYSYNNIEQDEDVISGGAVLFPKGTPAGVTFTGSASADYARSVGDRGYVGRISASAYTIGASRFVTSTGQAGSNDDLLIARTALALDAPNERWTVTFFVDNVTDSKDIQNAGPDADRNIFARPRTMGLQFEFRL